MYENNWIILRLIYFCMHLIESLASLCLFSKIFNFLASKLCMWVQWFSMGVVMLKKHFFKILVNYCLIKRFKGL
jgi:hypothetical protein